MILWNAQTGKKLEMLLDGMSEKKPINRAQFSPDGTWLHFVTNDGDGMYQCRVEKTGRVFTGLADAGWTIRGVSNDSEYTQPCRPSTIHQDCASRRPARTSYTTANPFARDLLR